MKERAFKFRWTTLLFYIALCCIIAAGLIAIISVQKPVREWLSDFEQTYETYKPKNQIQRIFDRYFAEPDIDELLGISEDRPEYNAPDTLDDAVSRYAEKINGKKMTFGYLAGSDQKVINVKADGKLVARFSVKVTEEKEYSLLLFSLTQPVYELESINLYFDKPTESANVRLPERFTAYAGDMLLTDEYLAASGIKDDPRESVPEGAFLFTYKVYSISGLYNKPEITVKDAAGGDVALEYDGEKNLYSCKYEYSEELKNEYADYVTEGLARYAIYMQDDARFKTLKDYFDPNSQLYEDIYNNPGSFVIEHDKYRVENKQASEFFDYGEVMSCHVTFDHVLTKSGREDYIDHFDSTLYLRKVDGVYRIFYMESHK
ncbi:MAG: hypothetical protein J5879_02670 [Clostridia bacterium]|nr:hypothetical protein [Clostridia bacterium]